MHIGIVKVDNYNLSNTDLVINIASFEKGVELGSVNYVEKRGSDVKPYLRVGDMIDSSNCVYVNEALAETNTEEGDIIVAFDGAPGRNSICLSGIRSSGLYKIICKDKDKGLLFFEINSMFNQAIIKDYSQGTTILHASKSINHLEYALINDAQRDELNVIFKQLVNTCKQIKRLKEQKQLLLEKYFTNQ